MHVSVLIGHCGLQTALLSQQDKLHCAASPHSYLHHCAGLCHLTTVVHVVHLLGFVCHVSNSNDVLLQDCRKS